jgi:D-alanyl-D-alanine carboxypeptidase/D-alanyl-D-alanine-endopeptidase (penicillin-binding protein 4)
MSRHALMLLLPVVSLFSPASSVAQTVAGRAAEHEQLRRALEDALAGSPMGRARAGMEVVSLDTGEVLFSHRAEELLNPASNVKLFTAAAALRVLGPAYRFETALLADAPPKAGRVKALYLRGRGDPTLTTERLHGMASELSHAGVREVQDLFCDDTWFDGELQPPGFDQEDGDRTYLAPPSALGLNGNTVGVYLRGGEVAGAPVAVEVEPKASLFELKNDARTGPRGQQRFNVRAERVGERIQLTVRGEVPAGELHSAFRKVDLPALYAGLAFRAVLEQHGIRVRGRVRPGPTPPGSKALVSLESETLDVVLRKLNKHSSNFVAEVLLKALSAQVEGPPGTTAGGVRAVEAFLAAEVGLPRGSYVMRNGSGLNDANRFSARQTVTLLRHAFGRFSSMPEYLASLPVAGRDGTLRSRMEKTLAEGNLRAKTGTLSHVSALAGYLTSASGERLAFSFLVNDYEGRAGPVVQALDAFSAAVAALGAPAGQGPAEAVALLTAPPPVLDDAALREKVKLYAGLGAAADLREAALLRGVFRSERDGAVRAAVADALYRCSPDEAVGARAVLEALEPADAVYGRLRRACGDLGVPVPGLGPLVDLAAAGHPEALPRLLALAQATPAPERTPFSRWLAELAVTAPEAVLAVLRPLPGPQLHLPVELLAQGLAAHPRGPRSQAFWDVLRRARKDENPAAAAFATALETRLVGALSEGADTSASQ